MVILRLAKHTSKPQRFIDIKYFNIPRIFTQPPFAINFIEIYEMNLALFEQHFEQKNILSKNKLTRR